MRKRGRVYFIETDGRTVWVNGPDGLWGRFGPNGVDVHVGGICAVAGCIPGPTNSKSWDTFKLQMQRVHGIRISDRYKPRWLKEQLKERSVLCRGPQSQEQLKESRFMEGTVEGPSIIAEAGTAEGVADT